MTQGRILNSTNVNRLLKYVRVFQQGHCLNHGPSVSESVSFIRKKMVIIVNMIFDVSVQEVVCIKAFLPSEECAVIFKREWKSFLKVCTLLVYHLENMRKRKIK